MELNKNEIEVGGGGRKSEVGGIRYDVRKEERFIFGKIFIMDHAVVCVPAAPLRRKAAHREEMVSQLLFGEIVKILKQKGELWVKVRSLHDNYEGWMSNTMLEFIEEQQASTGSKFLVTDLLNPIRFNTMSMHIPVGSSLPYFKNGRGTIGEKEFIFEGNYLQRDQQVPGTELVKKLVLPWLNAPYLWGGRTPLGVDCSGFVQVIYKMMGIDLPRDAWQQAKKGKCVEKFKESQPGDLAFFDNKEDIVHVGILLEDKKIIHASGKVRIDFLNKKGIINAETGKKTLRLKTLRRMW